MNSIVYCNRVSLRAYQYNSVGAREIHAYVVVLQHCMSSSSGSILTTVRVGRSHSTALVGRNDVHDELDRDEQQRKATVANDLGVDGHVVLLHHNDLDIDSRKTTVYKYISLGKQIQKTNARSNRSYLGNSLIVAFQAHDRYREIVSNFGRKRGCLRPGYRQYEQFRPLLNSPPLLKHRRPRLIRSTRDGPRLFALPFFGGERPVARLYTSRVNMHTHGCI
jgi:hypothetical protein